LDCGFDHAKQVIAGQNDVIEICGVCDGEHDPDEERDHTGKEIDVLGFHVAERCQNCRHDADGKAECVQCGIGYACEKGRDDKVAECPACKNDDDPQKEGGQGEKAKNGCFFVLLLFPVEEGEKLNGSRDESRRDGRKIQALGVSRKAVKNGVAASKQKAVAVGVDQKELYHQRDDGGEGFDQCLLTGNGKIQDQNSCAQHGDNVDPKAFLFEEFHGGTSFSELLHLL